MNSFLRLRLFFGVCFLLSASSLHAINTCSASASTRDVTPGPSVSVGPVTIDCSLDSAANTGAITLNSNVPFSASGELTVAGQVAATASPSPATLLSFASVGLPPGGVSLPANVTLRISKLRVNLSGGTPPANVTFFLTFQSLPVSNNVLTVANVSAPCDYSLSPASSNFDADGGSGAFDVSAPAYCNWTASESESWLSITAGGSGTGSGQVSYQVAANAAREARAGVIRVAGQNFEVRQAGLPAEADLAVTELTAAPSAEIGGGVDGVRAVVTNQGEGTAGAFRIGIYLSADDVFGPGDRLLESCAPTGLEPVGAIACTPGVMIPESTEPGVYYLLAFADDRRAVAESDEANNVAAVRLEVTALAPSVQPPAAVTSAATFELAAAPGLFVSLFGQGWTDDLYLAESLPYPRELGGVSVLLAGDPIPLSMASPNQINGLLPYSVAAGEEMEVRVLRGEDLSDPYMLTIAPVAPGLLTLTQDGRGQAAALTSDFQLADANHPVSPGGAVLIYCLGLGAVDPPLEAGEAADPAVALYRTVARIRLFVGGRPAEVLFSGLAPGFAGLYQVNGIVPRDVEPGDAVAIRIVVELEGGETLESNEATIVVAAAGAPGP